MVLFIILSLMFLLMFIIYLFTKWSVHCDMTVSYSEHWGYSNFENFKREFNKHEWYYNSYFEYSLFTRNNDTEIHAGIIKFDNKGMVLKPISYIKAQIFIRKYINKNFHEKKEPSVKW